MTSNAKTVEAYLEELPADRKRAVSALRQEVLKNLPAGFREQMGYGMIGYVVPHVVYPPGYHCDPLLPLPFAKIASQAVCTRYLNQSFHSTQKGREDSLCPAS